MKYLFVYRYTDVPFPIIFIVTRVGCFTQLDILH
jgi:hypothetical protein